MNKANNGFEQCAKCRTIRNKSFQNHTVNVSVKLVAAQRAKGISNNVKQKRDKNCWNPASLWTYYVGPYAL